jgi:hypothetical protein
MRQPFAIIVDGMQVRLSRLTELIERRKISPRDASIVQQCHYAVRPCWSAVSFILRKERIMAGPEVSTPTAKSHAKSRYAVAMNVVVMPATNAETTCRKKAGLTRPVADEAAAAATPRGKLVPGLPRTPSHNLVFRGGKIMPNLSYTNFFLGGSAAWKPDDRTNIDAKLAAAMKDTRLNSVMAQYFNGAITTNFHGPSKVLDGAAAVVFSKGDVETLVRQLHQANAFAGFDLGATVFNFMLSSGTELTTDEDPANASHTPAAQKPKPRPIADTDDDDKASSREGLGGYHGSVIIGTQKIYYAIGAFSEVLSDGTQNGIVAFRDPWKNVVATFYHELNEARTDPDVEEANNTGDERLVGWISARGEEIGDFPIFEDPSLTHVFKEVALADNSGTVPIQFMYSNRVNGPEDPTL